MGFQSREKTDVDTSEAGQRWGGEGEVPGGAAFPRRRARVFLGLTWLLSKALYSSARNFADLE